MASGEQPTSNQANDALQTLVDLLDSLSNESLMIYSKLRQVFPLVAGQQTYPMGVGAQFDSARPQKIENAAIQLSSSPTTELPMEIINKDEYQAIFIKTIQSTIPLWLYNDDAYPNTNINLWPVPQVVTNIVLYTWQPLNVSLTLQTSLSLPPGWLRMLRYNLAIDLSAEYGVNLNPQVWEIARETKSVLKRMNTKPLYLGMDAALAGPRGSFNWLTGDTV